MTPILHHLKPGISGFVKGVVAGVDGSPESLSAVAWAAREAALRGCGLQVVHAVPAWRHSPVKARMEQVRQWLWDHGRRIVDTAVAQARRAAPEVEVADSLVAGDPVPALLAAAQDAELLVVASQSGGRLTDLLLGSVTRKMVVQAACPVVVVRHDMPPERVFGEVVVGVDGSGPAQAALRFAVEEAALRGARLRVILAWRSPFPAAAEPPPVFVDMLELEAAEEWALTEAVRPYADSHPQVEIVRQLVAGHPVEALVQAATTADLLVVGSRGRGAMTGPLLGSVSQGVLHHAACPVAVVRPSG